MWEFISAHALEIAGTVLGFIYLFQEFKASPAMWITGIIMPCISLFVYYRAGLYADFGIDIYYILAAVYGFIVWKRGGRDKAPLPISHMPLQLVPLFALLFAAVFALIAFVLIRWTDSTVPYADAFTTALSIVALLMLARKWIEQWWAWAVVDAVSAALYIYKGIPFYAVLYSIYTIMAIYGYYKWNSIWTGDARAQKDSLRGGK
jgi:nicotinamide mononucleotide transporter